MVSNLITLKLEKGFLKEIDSVVKKQHYHNRTEFIRQALREKIDQEKLKQARALLRPLRGSVKRDISDEDYERAREDAYKKAVDRVR